MIVVVMPSRGRPRRALQAVEAALGLAALETTAVVVAIDADDPEILAYRETLAGSGAALSVLSGSETGNLVRATNTVSLKVAGFFPRCIIGNLGDDHLVRTEGWDERITEVLHVPGIAYGNDLLQGEVLPTAPFISARIVTALGWYMLPSLTHMFVDDVWKAIGEDLKRLIYLPDVVIEHMHPGAGKAPNDAGYDRADASTEADRIAFEEWCLNGRANAVEGVSAALR